ncbi:protein GrpE [Siminovitchia terrae]|uniref:Protein GrpE n=1 Tax=Siminovitchia terrae TaxID=1914933 RepID=A0A429XDG6_SIMTE|nr:nucleotide exchange factor GrpE [Siminovitchia terrae]RST61498.1 nucleotide exchange factor GrpE [Siminovitchia terrae]GIN89676.1 protein GrpE [Siminovitchia terrae]GIN96298.1 protein GrpE [Siminovitchia terrae]
MQEESKETLKPEDLNQENTAENNDVEHEELSGQENEQADDVQSSNQENEQEQELTNKIKELEAQLEEKESRYLRLLADFDNFRRRTKLDREADEKYRAQHLITNLLPAIDNFERAMQIEPDTEQTKALLEGVGMVYRSIIEALKTEGAEQIEAVGNEFDPNLHQAIMQAEEEGTEENIVLEEFQKGYLLKDRVIRPSMVKVSK